MLPTKILGAITEEEKILMRKYKLLREKRALLKNLNILDSVEEIEEKQNRAESGTEKSDSEKSDNGTVNATEKAKKLVKTGGITISQNNETKRKFKNASALERDLMKKHRQGVCGTEDLEPNKIKSKSPKYKYQFTTPPPSPPKSPSAGKNIHQYAQPPSSSSMPSSYYPPTIMDTACSSTTTEWMKLVEANRQRMMNNGGYKDFKRGVVSYKDVDGSSSDDD